MLVQSSTQLTIPEEETLFPRRSDSLRPAMAEEALHSHMIIGFEEALDLGMSPVDALSHVLHWVASEMARLNSKQQTDGAIPSGSSQKR
jgi:hypothetical protein